MNSRPTDVLCPHDLYRHCPRQDQVYDVIVAGGGPAGIGAALAAAMNGASTLVLESRSQFGGTAIAAMWMKINFLFKDNDETDCGGVHAILVDAIRQWGPDASISGRRGANLLGSGGNLDVHPEYLKVEGLLVAGRCSSATMLGHYGGKSMGNMISVGQGAGVAVALCAQLDTLPRQLDYRLIQTKLDEMGVSL